jgi:hypothetical protein
MCNDVAVYDLLMYEYTLQCNGLQIALTLRETSRSVLDALRVLEYPSDVL